MKTIVVLGAAPYRDNRKPGKLESLLYHLNFVFKIQICLMYKKYTSTVHIMQFMHYGHCMYDV